MPKCIQKRAQNRGLGDQGSDFWGFGRVFEESDFLWVFDRRKVGLKSTRLVAWGGHGANARRFEEGSAAEAVASRGFWSLTGTGRSLQKASRTPCSPQGGRRISRLKPHAADPQNIKNANIQQMSRMKIAKNITFFKVPAKTDCTIEFSAFFDIL